MKIGITERGDAGLDFTWHQKLNNNDIDGAILITKKITPAFIDRVLTAAKPVIVHATCTGWGGSWLEPNVPIYIDQLRMVKALIERGFDASRIVIRMDPIFPNAEGLERCQNVLNFILSENIPVRRVRISLYDEYPHSRTRLTAANHQPFYPNNSFGPTDEMMNNTIEMLRKFPMFSFETCAETKFMQRFAHNDPNIITQGCVSANDIALLGINADTENMTVNNQNRFGCQCLSCKTELLENKHRCANGCLYCYWKD